MHSPQGITHVTSKLLTAILWGAALCLPELGIHASDVSAQALRADGAMALLCCHVDTDVIKLVGPWFSDEMLKYLHLQAYPLMMHLAPLMVTGGNFRMLTHQTILPAAMLILFAA